MNISSFGEQWRRVPLPEGINSEQRIEVSNFGRVRTFNKQSNGNIIKGSLTEGFPVVRMKFFRPSPEAHKEVLVPLRAEITELEKKLRTAKKDKAATADVTEAENHLALLKKKYKKKAADFLKKRTIHFHFLIHRMVAELFLPKPLTDQKFIAHLDLNKTNNYAKNLKWITQEEHIVHRAKHPSYSDHMIKRRENPEDAPTTKLTVTKVMLLKKLLNEDKPLKALAKQFRITETQVLRIKRGENWKNIEAFQPETRVEVTL